MNVKRRTAFEKAAHWSLSFSVLAVWFFLEDGDAPHIYVGYFAFAVGLAQQFNAWKKDSQELLSDHPRLAFSVHNVIWGCLLGLAVSGWMMGLDRFWGVDWTERLHEALSWTLAAAVVLHLVGLVRDALKHKRASWLHMVTSLKG